ncbi:DUF192 domain-containing protein [Pseudaminobacter sp. NGMCC 1.201702]|uniref:DUF192 domain-containing protein n=1 Tax=Pseudaminobacter sp. NGMCC 1.201702 TaxID=3391825 RepID=UPI0039F07CD3
MSQQTFAAIGAAIAAGFFLLTASAPSWADGRAMVLAVDPAPLVVETATGPKSFTIEIADDPDERSAGLMFRKQMDADHGMLFVFEGTQAVGFWMKNTPLPLDLLFIGEDGRVKAVKRGEPLSEALIAPQEPVRYVLELNAGTAEKAGIAPGDLSRHPVMDGTRPQ